MQRLSALSNDALLHRLDVIVGSHRRVTTELVLHLGEVDARRLHVEKGFSSLFSYCVARLRFSEDEACRRIEAARLVRRFPAIGSLLSEGTVSLTVLGLLKPHLTDDNHGELLAGVSGSSVRKAKEWLAARFPVPDVPSSIRKLPERRASRVTLLSFTAHIPGEQTRGTTLSAEPPASTRAEEAARTELLSARATSPSTQVESRQVESLPAQATPQSVRGEPQSERAEPQSVRAEPPLQAKSAARIEPLSRDRFLVKFTASAGLREKIELASDLMRHAHPEGDIALVLERALDLLVAELEKTRQGRTKRPRRTRTVAKEPWVTRAVRRDVVARDGWRCSFVANDGHRCNSRAFLEFDHRIPKGYGGGSGAENLRVLCRAHNRLEAERAYGEARVSRAIRDGRQKGGKGPEGRDAAPE